MILVDTSVWVDHLRRNEPELADRLKAGRVLAHPYVIGELSLGNLRQREAVLEALHDLPKAYIAIDREVLFFIEQHALFGLGIGYVDTHLLASARVTNGWCVQRSDWRGRCRLVYPAGSLNG